MRCVVTAGPTFEPLDAVRRLTNFSTGRLGTELANFLGARGHEVILLIGSQATWRGERLAARVETFTTTENLRAALETLGAKGVDAVFHAAAVSDFAFGRVWRRSAEGDLIPIQGGKFSTRTGLLLVELTPVPKILSRLRGWFPEARLVGWKYEVDGRRPDVIRLAQIQIEENQTNACVANGPAYGPGYGLVSRGGRWQDLAGAAALFDALEQRVIG